LADSQIVIARHEGDVRFPIEDVAWVVIDTPQVLLSAALISACMDAGVVMITTDRTHTRCIAIAGDGASRRFRRPCQH
jgi:CRISP-associated protein Cas1